MMLFLLATISAHGARDCHRDPVFIDRNGNNIAREVEGPIDPDDPGCAAAPDDSWRDDYFGYEVWGCRVNVVRYDADLDGLTYGEIRVPNEDNTYTTMFLDFDNCPGAHNPDQWDTDCDELGDACDSCPEVWGGELDKDNDGIGDVCDVCPDVSDPGQLDSDGDGFGDACDLCPGEQDNGQDRDFDGVGDSCDNCVDVRNPNQRDSDGDGEGDACFSAPHDTLTGGGCSSTGTGGVVWPLLLVVVLGRRRRRTAAG
jgi:MYXO-CTERM domain-containing protein